MAKRKTSVEVKPIEQYTFSDKNRPNNPPVGLVTPETDKDAGKQTYAYDPHLDPQLVWAGKAEHTSFSVPTVSLHVHERIDPRTIVEAARRRHEEETGFQFSFFDSEQVRLPLYQEIEFYKHRHNWANRMIAGDSLLVMNSLLVKEAMAGSVQMIYFDPPYGIKYGSNFQPFVNKRDVKDGKDDDLTSEPETLKAFRDTWELGIHSYLTYLRDRLLLAKEMLHESGSIFVQISDENVHLVRNLMDEVFGVDNFVSQISFQKSGGFVGNYLAGVQDYLLWYSKKQQNLKYRQLYTDKTDNSKLIQHYKFDDGNGRRYRLSPINSQDISSTRTVSIEYKGKIYHPGANRHWSINPSKIPELLDRGILTIGGASIYRKLYLDEQPGLAITNNWDDTARGSFHEKAIYVVQTTSKTIQRCLLMTTDPGDLVLDITCGSGTTAFVAEQWGRRWITCDTSRVALTLAKQRLMTATFDYYQLAKPEEGISSGFRYETVPHVTLKSIANNEPPEPETLYDQPLIEKTKARVTSPFTVEAVPAPTVQSLSDANEIASETLALPDADASIARSGESLRQSEWRSELLKTGIRGRLGEKMRFSRVEPIAGTRFLHADAEVLNENGGDAQRAVISFAPEHEPLPSTQVERALFEANKLFPKPKFVIFAAFQFDPVAVSNIEQTNWPGVQLLKAQMNDDLKTADLKKNRTSNESFWLIGQPDVKLNQIGVNEYTIEVLGFDYYNVKAGTIESGSANRIAVWMLDTNFDGRSLFPHQVFFPMAGEKDGWTRLANNLRAEIDAELIETYRGNVSLPFAPGSYKRIAVKIVDDRGIESLKLIDIV